VFRAETPLNSTYGFPFWRISYLYDFLRRRGDEVSIGVSLQIRDATITFTSADGTLRADRRDVGPVPTLKFRGRWGFESGVWWGTEIDGIDLRACASSDLAHASASSAMNQNLPKPRKLLLTGATGFVGRHLNVALAETDWEVVRGTRNPKKASQPGWVYLDVADPSAIRQAIAGCDAAVYLIHSIDDSKDYPEREDLALVEAGLSR